MSKGKMNNLTIPPSATWYTPSILACAPDNTLIYGTVTELVVIRDSDVKGSNDIIQHRVNTKVLSVKCSPNWSEKEQLVAVFSENGSVFIWDILNKKKKSAPEEPCQNHDKFIDGDFAGSDKLVSAFEKGIFCIWRISSNEITHIKQIFKYKVNVECMALNPHVSYIVAVGLKNGRVAIIDLRNKGRLVHIFNGHNISISSLSWCPTPYNALELNQTLLSKVNTSDDLAKAIEHLEISQNDEEEKVTSIEIDEEEDGMYNGFYRKVENAVNNKPELVYDDLVKNGGTLSYRQMAKLKKRNIWVGLKHADDDEIAEEKRKAEEQRKAELEEQANKEQATPAEEEESPEVTKNEEPLDFNDECKKLLEEIKQRKAALKEAEEKKNENDNEEVEEVTERKILKAKRKDDNDKEAPIEDEIKIEKEPVEIEVENTETKEANNKEATSDLKIRKDMLLASVGKDGSVCIWKTVNYGKMECKLYARPKSSNKLKQKESPYETVFWMTPHILLSTSNPHKILMWDFSTGSNPSPKVLNCDQNVVFCITSKRKIYSSYDVTTWKLDDNPYVWTFSRDNYLMKISLKITRDILVSYPTISRKVVCIASSPIDPCRIAISSHFVATWDISKPLKQTITMTRVNLRLGDVYTSLAWHMEKENWLAYGTIHGKIGYFNLSNSSNVQINSGFVTEVYKVEWGPYPGSTDEKKKWALYVVCNGTLMYFNVDSAKKEGVKFPFTREEQITHFSWKPDFTMIAVGTQQGAISLFSNNFEHLTTVYAQPKQVYGICWHPMATAEDSELSKFHTKFAVISDTDIYIYDTSSLDLNEADQGSSKVAVQILKTWHSKRIHSICWSSHQSGYLASVCKDIVLVYNTAEEKLISVFADEALRPIAPIHWSPLDQNQLIVGLHHNALHIYNLTDHPAIEKNELDEFQKKCAVIYSKPKKLTEKVPSTEVIFPPTTKEKKSVLTFKGVLPNVASLQHTLGFKLLENDDDKEDSDAEKKKKKVLSKFFGNQADMQEVIVEERDRHIQMGRYTNGHLLSLWNGDMGDIIRNAMKNNLLNPWLVNMSVMVSPKLWQECCEAYALQLQEGESPDSNEIASYYLACHKVEEAINALCNGKLFRDAYSLTKLRLGESNERLPKILEDWAKYEEVVGEFELAADLYSKINMYNEAAMCLSKRKIKVEEDNAKVAKLCLNLAKKGDNKELIESFEARYLEAQLNTHLAELPTRASLILNNEEVNSNEKELEQQEINKCSQISSEINTIGEVIENIHLE